MSYWPTRGVLVLASTLLGVAMLPGEAAAGFRGLPAAFAADGHSSVTLVQHLTPEEKAAKREERNRRRVERWARKGDAHIDEQGWIHLPEGGVDARGRPWD